MSLNIFNKEKKDCDPVPVGGSSKEFKSHIGNMITSAFGSHGLRYDESNKKLFIKKNNGQEEEFAGGSQNMISDAWTPKSYTQGQICIDDNKLWKAKATTDDQKPAEGQMWELTTMEKEFSKLNSDNESKDYAITSNGTLYFYSNLITIKNKRAVMNVNAIPNANLSKNTTITIGNIPSDVIPKMQVNQLAWNEQLMFMRFIVNVDGSVVIQPQQDYTKGVHNIKVQAVWDIA